MDSFFLYFHVRVEGQVREVVIENDDCYRDLQHEIRYNGVAAYRKFAKQLLHSKDTLQLALTAADYPEMHFLDPCPEIAAVAKVGVDSLTAHHYLFKPGPVLLINVRSDSGQYFDSEQQCIIRELFKLNRFVMRDDESGYLVVYRPITAEQLAYKRNVEKSMRKWHVEDSINRAQRDTVDHR